jgi:hypothetical protein
MRGRRSAAGRASRRCADRRRLASFFYLYLIDETLTDGPLIAIVDLPRPVDADTFDAAAFVEAFWQAGAPVLTRH